MLLPPVGFSPTDAAAVPTTTESALILYLYEVATVARTSVRVSWGCVAGSFAPGFKARSTFLVAEFVIVDRQRFSETRTNVRGTQGDSASLHADTESIISWAVPNQ
jgi:hypothetical protein